MKYNNCKMGEYNINCEKIDINCEKDYVLGDNNNCIPIKYVHNLSIYKNNIIGACNK